MVLGRFSHCQWVQIRLLEHHTIDNRNAICNADDVPWNGDHAFDKDLTRTLSCRWCCKDDGIASFRRLKEVGPLVDQNPVSVVQIRFHADTIDCCALYRLMESEKKEPEEQSCLEQLPEQVPTMPGRLLIGRIEHVRWSVNDQCLWLLHSAFLLLARFVCFQCGPTEASSREAVLPISITAFGKENIPFYSLFTGDSSQLCRQLSA